MSRPRYWWYGNVKREVQHYNESLQKKQPAYVAQVKAVDKALADTATMQDGEKRIYAVREVLIERRKSIISVAMEYNYHENVIRLWISDFIRLVGAYRGYEGRKKVDK